MKASVPSKKAASAVRKAYLPSACAAVNTSGVLISRETILHY